ncbi:HD domain-containing protein [Nostocaceae cyanobacterium CENA357]|uniref:HD domain-containing protein n=1 Tax=Atlanticothrix silvestris CENA357 TaxID=1725252 RepID=A0A8J7HKW0_9CYAN|nr:HD domain-containing protein [Atlanticothrix silvestris]MBH8554959.1 HD domain-containing protein [Atlanticothrix silvestris CENA357]
MVISRQQAWNKLLEWTSNPSLFIHARSVEIVMRRAAHLYGGNEQEEERWGLAGLIHDADYELWPEEHPKHIVAWLEEQKEPEIAYAVAAHNTKWGVPHITQLDKALLACDELTGFVIACSKVRPDGIQSLDPSSVLKRLKTKSFAAKVDRDEIHAGSRELGVDLSDHIAFVIDILKDSANDLEI